MESTENIPVVTCKCGEIIPPDTISYYHGDNDEGEEYGEVTAECKKCGADHTTWQWGAFDDKNEAMSYLNDDILGKHQ